MRRQGRIEREGFKIAGTDYCIYGSFAVRADGLFGL